MTRFASWRVTCVWLLAWWAAAPLPARAQALPPERADVNHDCAVTQADLTLVIASYNKRAGQPGFNPDADVDRDGAVTLTDRTFVQRAIGTPLTCTPPVPPPQIAASVSPAANANGWHRGDVTVSFTCQQATTCPPPITLATEGANQIVERTVSNSAGATATARVTINLDRTPPALAVTLPSTGAPGGSAPLAVAATDLSGVAEIIVRSGSALLGTLTTAPYQLTIPFPAQAGASRTLDIVATDRAGNAASVVRTLQAQAPDTTLPIVSIAVVQKAAPGAVVPVTVRASDPGGLSHLTLGQVDGSQSVPLADTTSAPFSLQHAFTVPEAPDGTTITFVARAEDASGNSGSSTKSLVVASRVESETLALSVEPPVTPTFQTATVLRGRLQAGTGSAPPRPPAFIATLSVPGARLGEALDVIIAGVNTAFETGRTQVTFGAGIAVDQLVVLTPERVRVSLRVDPRASLGPRLVAVSTGEQEAFLANAFTVFAGDGTVSGRLLATGGAPIAAGQGRVCLPNSATCAVTDASGAFTLAVQTSTSRVIASAAGFDAASVPVAVAPGGTRALGDIVLLPIAELPPPPAPNGPVLPARLATTLARMYAADAEPQRLTAEQARRLVTDAVLLVGADELGVLDPDGRQLNTEVSGSGPISLTDRTVEQQARVLRQGVGVSLEELAFIMAMGLEWSEPGPPSPALFVSLLQQRVDEAWVNPTAPESSLAILLFNHGATLARHAPRLSGVTRVNSLQAFLMLSGVLLDGHHARAAGGSARLDPIERDNQVDDRGTPTRGLWARLVDTARDAVRFLPRPASSSPRASASASASPLSQSSVSSLSSLASASSATWELPARRGDPWRRAWHTRAEQGGGGPAHARRQLSRMLEAAAVGHAERIVQAGQNAWATLGVGAFVQSLFTTVGVALDEIRFMFDAGRIEALTPPPPVVVATRQTGNKVVVRLRRVPAELQCRVRLKAQPTQQATLCNFQYTIYRYSPTTGHRIVVSRLVRGLGEDVAPGLFEIEDAYPQPGLNEYYADVIQRLPAEVPEPLRAIAAELSLPTRASLPVGDSQSLFYITELVSDFSEPNHTHSAHFNPLSAGDPDQPDWADVSVDFVPRPPTSSLTQMRSDRRGAIFANDQGLSQFAQQVPGLSIPVIHPGFGRGAGLDLDANGHLYTVSDSSQAQFGGRVFQVRRNGEQFFVGTVTKYSPMLDIGRATDVSALAVGPGLDGAVNAFVSGDIFVADNGDRTIKRLPTSIIPAAGIGALPAPGHGVFGAMAASPIVGFPYVSFPNCTGVTPPIRDIAFDRNQALWAIVGTDLYRIGYDSIQGAAGRMSVAANLSGRPELSSVRITVRGSERREMSVAHRARLRLVAESQPCAGHFRWETSDSETLSLRTLTPPTGTGSSEVEIIGLRPGKATITVSFTQPGGEPVTASLPVTVLESGPILLVHGWTGAGSRWETVMAGLEEHHLLRGGSLCASWVKERGRFATVQNADQSYRPGNIENYVCDDPAIDGSFFTLNFEDNQYRFIDTAAELSDIVDQILRKLGGDECASGAGDSSPLPESCPRLTVVAHSMGGQTARAFIQSIPHGPFSVPDYGPRIAVPPPPGGWREPTPFRPFRGQIAKMITVGTMNLGTPVANLSKEETFMYVGAMNLVAAGTAWKGDSIDPMSSGVESMQVGSGEWQLLLRTQSLDALRALDLVSIVTQAPESFSFGVCLSLTAAEVLAPQVFARLSPQVRAVLTGLAIIGGLLVEDFTANAFKLMNDRICGLGNQHLTVPVLGSTLPGVPSNFLRSSDEIVGVDSQNINNVFRLADGVPDPISYECRDETPGVTPGAVAKVKCLLNVLHTESQRAVGAIVEEIIPTNYIPEPREGAPTASAESDAQLVNPSVAQLVDPRYLAVDDANNIFIADRSQGSVTVLRRDGTMNTFVTGLTAAGPIAVEGAYLYAARNGDIVRLPLGISGRLLDSTGQPVRQALVVARGFGGAQTRAVTTDNSGAFSLALEAFEAQIDEDRARVFLTVTVPATAEQPLYTEELSIPLDVSPQGRRTQTVADLTLPQR